MSTSVFPGERPDRLEEECGVFGIYAPGLDVARMTCFGLQALQHQATERLRLILHQFLIMMIMQFSRES